MSEQNEPVGVLYWWSTFYQRWNRTVWQGFEHNGRCRTAIVQGKPILSNDALLQKLKDYAAKAFPAVDGKARLIESAYSAAWSSDAKHHGFLASKVEWLVCHEL